MKRKIRIKERTRKLKGIIYKEDRGKEIVLRGKLKTGTKNKEERKDDRNEGRKRGRKDEWNEGKKERNHGINE